MKQRTKKIMEGKECFLKDLKEGDTFRMRHTGGTVYTFYQKGDFNYIVTTESGSFFASPTTPVKPLKQF
jgi:hypothetical protein